MNGLEGIDTLAELMNVNDEEQVGDGAVTEVLLDLIVPDPNQPRQNISDERVASLIPSIKEHGVIQPIIVSEIDDGKYMIIAGERRWQASRLAGKHTIPVIVRDVTQSQRKAFQIIENLHRENLTPMEEANYIYQLLNDEGIKIPQNALAKHLGVSEAWVSLRLSLLKTPDPIKTIADSGVTSDIDTLVKLGKLYNENPERAMPFIEDPQSITRKAVRDAKKGGGQGSVQSDLSVDAATDQGNAKKPVKKSNPKQDVSSEASQLLPTVKVRFNNGDFTLLLDREAEPGFVWVKGKDGSILSLDYTEGDVVLAGIS